MHDRNFPPGNELPTIHLDKPPMWVANEYDPQRPDARQHYCFSTTDPTEQDIEWGFHLHWLKTKRFGRPAATEHCSVEQLEAMGMVGVYER